jgi:hypothetical protein
MGRARTAWGIAVVSSAWAVGLACSSSQEGSPGVTCGPGTAQQGGTCVPAPVDGASPVEAGADVEAGGDDASKEAPPIFGGVTGVAPVSATRLFVTWSPGADADDADDPVTYRVYVAPQPGPLDYTKAAVLVRSGARGAYLDGLDAATTYLVGVRAVDEAGLDDGNTITMTGTPHADDASPTFAGAKTAKPSPGAVALTWEAAKDDLSPAAAIQYLVYASTTSGGQDYTRPTVVTAPGDLSATVTHLPGPSVARYFVVRARDAAGNIDANTTELTSFPGPDATPPVFAGCTGATTVSALSIAVSWDPATDETSDVANVSYDIFASKTPGTYDYTRPFATVKGTTGAVLPALDPGTRYYFVCRAKDEAGNEDSNVIEVSSKTGNNAVPPTFGGITTFTGDPAAFTADIGWAAGSDDVTPPDQLVYDVYVAKSPGGEAYNRPPFASSAVGALSITVTGLAPNATLYFVVRARDADGNHDVTPNPVEKSMTTDVSFKANVQPIFAHDCGVVGCHVPGNPTGGLILASGFAYAQIVGVNALELNGLSNDGGTYAYVTPGDPADSYLNIKINNGLLTAFKAANPSFAPRMGTQMPAPSTGSTLTQDELNTIANWITQGAANN